MLNRLGNKKRVRERESTPVLQNDFKLTSSSYNEGNDLGNRTVIGSIEKSKIIQHLQVLGKEFKTQHQSEIYVTIEVDIAFSRYIEENQDSITKSLKDNFKIIDLILSSSIVGSLDKYITLNGRLHSVIRSALFLSYLAKSELNNIIDKPITLKTHFSLTLVLQDKMDFERINHIERRAKFTSIQYYDLMTPTYFQSKGSILKLAASGNFKSLFDFLAYIVETSKFSTKYLDDSLILQYPVVKADDSSLFQRQDINTNKLENNIKNAVKAIFGEEFVERNQVP